MVLPDPRIQLLDAMGQTSRTLRPLARHLRHQSSVRRATYTSDLLPVAGGGHAYGQYVEAELESGRVLCWALSLEWPDGKWHVDAQLTVNRDGEQQPLVSLVDDDVSGDEVVALLVTAAAGIRQSVLEAEDLATLAASPGG